MRNVTLVIVDDYSRFTWVKCLRSKDEAPDFIIKFLSQDKNDPRILRLLNNICNAVHLVDKEICTEQSGSMQFLGDRHLAGHQKAEKRCRYPYGNWNILLFRLFCADTSLKPLQKKIEFSYQQAGMQRLSTTFKPKEPTFQVALDVLSLTPFYPAFLITVSVPAIYMHEFWTFASYHNHSIRFKLNIKSYSFDLDTFRNMLQMCPKLLGQKFVDPPFKEEILTFMRELGYSGNIKLLSDVKVDILPQLWRTFETIINKCLSGKVTGIDTLRLSRA
ncbi:hypothetical protein Tco_0085674 [Tanacetum coccineum]